MPADRYYGSIGQFIGFLLDIIGDRGSQSIQIIDHTAVFIMDIEKAEDDKTEYENEGHYEGVIFK